MKIFSKPFLVTILCAGSATFGQITRTADICPGSCNADVLQPKVYKDKLYFRATTTDGAELWAYDGINAPVAVTNVSSSLYPANFTEYNNILYFTGLNQPNGSSVVLWACNGVDAPYMVNPTVSYGPAVKGTCLFKDSLYALTSFGLNAYGGSGEGLLKPDINWGNTNFPQRFLGATNDNIYFSVYNYDNSYEVWRYNGTGNPICLNTLPGIYNGTPADANSGVAVGNTFYFVAADATHGFELWSHTGSGAANMVYDIYSGTADGVSGLGKMVNLNGTIYFQGTDAANGTELWKYDGVNAPSMVANIKSGSGSSNPSELTVIRNTLYFAATDDTHGTELWQYDGVNAPSLVQDVASGTASFNPTYLVEFNNKLYMVGTGDSQGNELWEYALPVITEKAEPFSGNSFHIYPNPVQRGETFIIEDEQSIDLIRIFNSVGVELYSGTKNPGIQTPGIFYVEIQQGEKRTLQKIMVQ